MDIDYENYLEYLNGDENGFTEIVKRHQNGLIIYINTIVNDMFVAEELTEDTFIKIGLKKPRYNRNASFKTWIYTIGKNVALDYVKKKKALIYENIDDHKEKIEESVEDRYLKGERDKIVHKALDQLKPIYKEIIWLRYFGNFSTEEISKIMKMSEKHTRVVESRARQSLREILKEQGKNENS